MTPCVETLILQYKAALKFWWITQIFHDKLKILIFVLNLKIQPKIRLLHCMSHVSDKLLWISYNFYNYDHH